MVVQTVTVPEETPELLALAHRHDLIAGVVSWADLTQPDVAEHIAALRGLSAVAEAGLAYDLVVKPHQLPACPAERLPHLTFVLDHLGKPPIAADELEPWATSVRALAR